MRMEREPYKYKRKRCDKWIWYRGKGVYYEWGWLKKKCRIKGEGRILI